MRRHLAGENKRMRRPKSACGVRSSSGSHPPQRPRPCSALGIRSHGDENNEWRLLEHREAGLRSGRSTPTIGRYRRCLKMLGLLPNTSERIENKPDTKNVSARVQTFVARRTVSQDDIREAALKEMDRSVSAGGEAFFGNVKEEKKDITNARKLLARAVYEQWYFEKLEAAKKLKKEQSVENKTQQWQQIRVKQERYEKSQEKFKEWMERKNRQMKSDIRRLKELRDDNKRKQSTKADLPYNTWKEQKDKIQKECSTKVNKLRHYENEEREMRLMRRTEANKVSLNTFRQPENEEKELRLIRRRDIHEVNLNEFRQHENEVKEVPLLRRKEQVGFNKPRQHENEAKEIPLIRRKDKLGLNSPRQHENEEKEIPLIRRKDKLGLNIPRQHENEEKEKPLLRPRNVKRAYDTWKKTADEKYKLDRKEDWKNFQDEAARMRKESEEKARNARAAFMSWSRQKADELQKELRERRQWEMEEYDRQKNLLAERQEMSQQAYLRWLDDVDEGRRPARYQPSRAFYDKYNQYGGLGYRSRRYEDRPRSFGYEPIDQFDPRGPPRAVAFR